MRQDQDSTISSSFNEESFFIPHAKVQNEGVSETKIVEKLPLLSCHEFILNWSTKRRVDNHRKTWYILEWVTRSRRVSPESECNKRCWSDMWFVLWLDNHWSYRGIGNSWLQHKVNSGRRGRQRGKRSAKTSVFERVLYRHVKQWTCLKSLPPFAFVFERQLLNPFRDGVIAIPLRYNHK